MIEGADFDGGFIDHVVEQVSWRDPSPGWLVRDAFQGQGGKGGKAFNGVDSLITADDANHTRQRKLLTHAFADKTLKDLEPMLKSWVAKMSTKLAEQAAAGQKIDMLKMYNCTTVSTGDKVQVIEC